MANKNTNPGIGKAAVPTGINNAQPVYSPKPRQPTRPKPYAIPKSSHPQIARHHDRISRSQGVAPEFYADFWP